MKKEPHHFTIIDFFKALFGSFVISMTFLFKGSLVGFASKMNLINVYALLVVTSLLVTLEIYFLSYRFVQDRKQRPFYEFWATKFFTIMSSSFVSIYLLIYLYGVDKILSQSEMLKVTIAILLPATIVGSAVEILKK